MSHKASYWLAALPPDTMSGNDFRVLFHLCDAHNSKRDPATACFPSQATLRAVTGLSNGGLNNALSRLEAGGLIRRRRTRNADGTQGPTYYMLGCDDPAPHNGDGQDGQIPADNSGDRSVDNSPADSISQPSPTPYPAPNRLHQGGDKPVKEPVKEPYEVAGVDPYLSGTANLIRSGKRFLCQSISAEAARRCIEARLVSPEECQEVGIAV